MMHLYSLQKSDYPPPAFFYDKIAFSLCILMQMVHVNVASVFAFLSSNCLKKMFLIYDFALYYYCEGVLQQH